MTELSDLAASFQSRLTELSERTSRRAVRLWRDVSVGSLDEGWDAVAPRLEAVVSAAQMQAARMASPYVARSLALQEASTDPVVGIPESFAGVTREGREVVPEMYTAVTTAKSLIGAGAGIGAAFQAGASVMSIIAASLVSDAGRGASGAVSAGRGITRSVRVIQPGACSRCAVLAGVTGLRPFERHPRCRCTNMVLTDDVDVPEGFFESPGDYFDSLAESEQDRVFTKAGAEAIRLGADPVDVVNARRGATRAGAVSRLQRVRIGTNPDGSSLLGYVTSEGTTVRGGFGRARNDLVRGANDRYRRTRTKRLMPETILTLTDDVELRKVLLRDAGYVRPVIRDASSNAWIAENAARRAADTEIATAFYRSLGIR